MPKKKMDALTRSGTDDKKFWEFSVEIYTRPGIESACLHLQDNFGLNINLMLFCDWLGISGRGRIDAADVAIMTVACSHWHSSVVEPLRSARRVVQVLAEQDADIKRFRRQLLHDELAAEKIEQKRIAKSCARHADDTLTVAERCSDAIANLAAYLGSTRVGLDAKAKKMVSDLVAATFPEIPKAQVTKQVNKALD